MTETGLSLLPAPWREALAAETAEEIRLRTGQHPLARTAHGTVTLSGETVTPQMLLRLLDDATERSRYAAEPFWKEGFWTMPNGDRIGICGRCVCDKDGVRTVTEISSVCIRIASAHPGIGVPLSRPTLIIGPPGCGKTSLLRDCIRILSDCADARVGIVDERGEIAACVGAVPSFAVGRNTDVLTGCPKGTGIRMLLRSMAPEWIAVDEITASEDVEAMHRAGYCGVKFLATAHAECAEDLKKRPVYRAVTETGLFEELIVMEKNHAFRRERLC